MSYELFIALRYLRAKRRQAAVSVLTAIAVIGISAGVAALIIAQAVVTGFRGEVQQRILAGTAHLNLLRKDNGGIDDYRGLADRVRAVPGVRAISATTYEPVLLTSGDRQEQAILKGVDLAAPREANEVFGSTIDGNASDLGRKSEEVEETAGTIVIGRELARAMGLRVGSEVTAVSSQNRLTPVGLIPRPRFTRLRVVGIFASGLYEYDSKWGYISLDAAQKLKGEGDVAGVIQMKLDDIDAVDEVGRRVRELVGSEYLTTSWQELNRPLFAALSLQQKVVVVFFAMLIVMAALNIITTLTMTVIEKHRDIAILRAQGSTAGSIMKIFVWQGVVIGLIGAALGTAVGVAVSWMANRYQWISIPAEIYSVSSVTLEVRWFDCVAIAVLALLICFIATLYPARKAASLTPVEALRYE
jgi:lipoprotein-releasing system permease protein